MIELKPATQAIIVDEILPHAPETIWKALTSSRLIARWIMEPTGFAPVEGTRFTFRTTPAGAWDGTIHCQVLEVVPNERLSYSWKGGDDGNVGYGSRLDTVVTWTLSGEGDGTRVRLVYRSERDDWIIAMASAGLGFGFIPQYCVTDHPGIVARPLVEPEIWREVNLVTVRGRPHSPEVDGPPARSQIYRGRDRTAQPGEGRSRRQSGLRESRLAPRHGRQEEEIVTPVVSATAAASRATRRSGRRRQLRVDWVDRPARRHRLRHRLLARHVSGLVPRRVDSRGRVGVLSVGESNLAAVTSW